MPRQRFRSRLVPATSFSPRALWQLRSRELDLLLLAGCSCLITALSHPVAEALAQQQSTNGAVGPVAAQTNAATQTQIVPVSAAVPAKRDEIQDDETSG